MRFYTSQPSNLTSIDSSKEHVLKTNKFELHQGLFFQTKTTNFFETYLLVLMTSTISRWCVFHSLVHLSVLMRRSVAFQKGLFTAEYVIFLRFNLFLYALTSAQLRITRALRGKTRQWMRVLRFRPSIIIDHSSKTLRNAIIDQN